MVPVAIYCSLPKVMQDNTNQITQAEDSNNDANLEAKPEKLLQNVNKPENEPEEVLQDTVISIVNEWEDIIGNGQLMKKIIRKGEDWTKPMKGDICILNIEGHLEDSLVMVEKHNDLEIFVGEGDLIQGLDLVIVLMNTKELAEVKVHSRFAYGKLGEGTKIPPNSNIIYTIELLTSKCFDIMEINYDQRKEMSNKKRSRGNWWFERNEPYNALQCYEKALACLSIEDLSKEHFPNDHELALFLDLSLVIRNNMAVTQIKLGSFDDALENVNYVLKYQPNNVKALHRKAKILTHKEHYTEAYGVYNKLHKLLPLMKSLQEEMSALTKVISKNAKKEKNLYRRMLGVGKGTAFNNQVSNTRKTEESKNEMSKKMLWGLIGGASAVICSILIHKFIL